MEVDTEYGTVIVCDECEEGCGINGYGEWKENIDDYAHICPKCCKQFKGESSIEKEANSSKR